MSKNQWNSNLVKCYEIQINEKEYKQKLENLWVLLIEVKKNTAFCQKENITDLKESVDDLSNDQAWRTAA